MGWQKWGGKMSDKSINNRLNDLVLEYEEMRRRHIKQQRTEDMVMKGLFVAMCPLLLPILFMR